MSNADGRGGSSAEAAWGPEPSPGGRGWAALYLAAKFEKALVVLESNGAAARAVDRIEAIRNRAQSG